MRKFTCFSRWAPTELTPAIIDYQDLVSKNLSIEILEGFGLYSLGLIGVRNIPEYAQNRLKLLNLSRKLINLSPEGKAEMMRKQEQDFVGWREPNNNPKDIVDYLKASFYANPEVDSPLNKGDWADNIWPHKSVPELEHAFKTLGQQMIHVSTLMSQQIDQMISSKSKSYIPNTIHNISLTHKNHISRLIYYYPQNIQNDEWVVWHKDFTTFSLLTPSIYFNHLTGEIISGSEVDNPNVGLFVKNRKGDVVKVKMEPDTLILQVGEIVQILSGGLFEATPHAVLNDGSMKDIGRAVFAVFMQPKGNFVLDCDTPDNVFIEHDGIISLKTRWEPKITFNEYIQRTIKALY